MSKSDGAPRLHGFAHFVAAAGILAAALGARFAAERLGQDTSWIVPLAALLCALEVGVGIGELRGLKYARYVREAALPASERPS